MNRYVTRPAQATSAYKLHGFCSYSTLTSASLATSADSKRSAFLIACQTAYYNGSTMANVILDTSGNLSDITCTDNTAYQDAECQKGYTGVLCTNCADGYGNSRTFHCTECMHSVPTNTFLIFLGYFASFCYVAWLVRGCLASAAQVGKAEGDHFEQFSDMMKVGMLCCAALCCAAQCCAKLLSGVVYCAMENLCCALHCSNVLCSAS